MVSAAILPHPLMRGCGWLSALVIAKQSDLDGGEERERGQRGHDEGDREQLSVGDRFRVDEIAAVQFVREPNPFPHFPGQESLTVRFIGPASMAACFTATSAICTTGKRYAATR